MKKILLGLLHSIVSISFFLTPIALIGMFALWILTMGFIVAVPLQIAVVSIPLIGVISRILEIIIIGSLPKKFSHRDGMIIGYAIIGMTALLLTL